MAQEIIVIIDQEGQPSIEVNGVKGKSCYDLTKDLEKSLGQPMKDSKTREFYESERATVRNRTGR